jgi:hypothetical protein
MNLGHALDSALLENAEGHHIQQQLAICAILLAPGQTYDEPQVPWPRLPHDGNEFNPPPLMLR